MDALLLQGSQSIKKTRTHPRKSVTLRALLALALAPLLASPLIPSPRAFAQQQRQPLKIVTYNVWGLPSFLLRHAERFRELPSAINSLDADVVLIQEAFNEESEALTRLPRFPYVAKGPASSFLRFNSGLLILSKLPILETAERTYGSCAGVDCFTNKGALLARIEIPGIGPVDVYNTHLNANRYEGARARQAEELLEFARENSVGRPGVIGGDFNGDSTVVFRKLEPPLSLRDAHAESARRHPADKSRAEKAGFTADPKRNPYLDRTETQRRLDAILLLESPGSGHWNILSDSLVFDHPILSDHFGVREVLEYVPPESHAD